MKHLRLTGLLWYLLVATGATYTFCTDSSFAAEHRGLIVGVEEILKNNLIAVRPELSFKNMENLEKILEISEAQYTLVARYRATSDRHMASNLICSHWPNWRDVDMKLGLSGVRRFAIKNTSF